MRKGLKDLGYSEKWVKFGLIDDSILSAQMSFFQKEGAQNPEHYRYSSFLNWLHKKKTLTDVEIENYLELALEDPDTFMAGSAVKQLFTAKQITERQFELIKSKLPQFGLWTQKLINRETLKRRILNEKLTKKLFKICVKNAKDFKDNSLIELMIQKTNEVSFLQELTADHYGKSIRNRAKEKIKIVKNLGKIDFKSQE